MSSRTFLLIAVALAVNGCADTSGPTAPPGSPAPAPTGNVVARERLARALALALADAQTRATIKHRLDASNAREGKVQFQALVHTEQGALLLALARATATNAADLLADLDAARGLELYLPVPSQRAAWSGDANYLVGTIGSDGDNPVAFDAAGRRQQLDPRGPPATPVLALVPQETDFTRGQPEHMLACVDMCGEREGTGGGATMPNLGNDRGPGPGLYLVQSHIDGSYESWLKGEPEYEYHVYGLGENGQTVELACTAEKSGGIYGWDQNDRDWSGLAMLFSDADYNAYQFRHPGSPIRIMAWEDDDETCIDHANTGDIAALISAVDKAYQSVTSGKVDPWYARGIKAAASVFTLINALHNVILTNDEFIGNGVEGTITGDAPNGSNWVLKSNGTVTTGWFTTQRVK